MLDRSTIRPGRFYWVKHRKNNDAIATLALVTGELPSLSIKPLDDNYIPGCSEYDFLAEADFGKLWEATFLGTTLEEVLNAPVVRIAD